MNRTSDSAVSEGSLTRTVPFFFGVFFDLLPRERPAFVDALAAFFFGRGRFCFLASERPRPELALNPEPPR